MRPCKVLGERKWGVGNRKVSKENYRWQGKAYVKYLSLKPLMILHNMWQISIIWHVTYGCTCVCPYGCTCTCLYSSTHVADRSNRHGYKKLKECIYVSITILRGSSLLIVIDKMSWVGHLVASPEPLGKGIPERECGVELLPDDCFVSTRRVTSVTLANR